MSQKSKRRHCPAAQGEITPAECGESRNSRYACPADCPHNPFAPANYAQLLAIEDAVDKKTLFWALDHAADRAALEREVQRALAAPSAHAAHALISWRLLFQRDGEGLTCAERWERDGFLGLKNDGRALMLAKRQTRVALLEARHVLDTECTEVVDLFEPGGAPFVVRDRGLAAQAVRFAPFLGWCYPLPHFRRLSGSAIVLPEMGSFEPMEIVTELVRHLGGPADAEGMRRWLAEHFVRFDEALAATAFARRQDMLAQVDVQTCHVVYELNAAFDQCCQTLDNGPDVDHDTLSAKEQAEGFTETRVWFDPNPAVPHTLPAGGQQSLGRVLLGARRWRLDAFSTARMKTLRQLFEARMDDRVRFVSESRQDLARQMALKQPPVDSSLVPARLLEEPQKLVFTNSRVPPPPPGQTMEDYQAELMAAANREFPDKPIPMFGSRTPREAARDPALRPKLIRLLKARVRATDEQNLRLGRTDDINGLLRELGATEILFDPPPPRPRPEPARNPVEDADFDGEDSFEDDFDLSESPRLPAEPLTHEEAFDRLRSAVDGFETAREAMDELDASGATLLDDVDALVGDLLTDDELSFQVPVLLQTWFALVPRGCRAPHIEFDALDQAFTRHAQTLIHELNQGSPKGLERAVAKSRQPTLMLLLALQLLQACNAAPKKMLPRLEAQPVMLAVVMAVVDQLDLALRH